MDSELRSAPELSVTSISSIDVGMNGSVRTVSLGQFTNTGASMSITENNILSLGSGVDYYVDCLHIWSQTQG